MVFRAIFDKIKQGLARTRSVFSGIASLFRRRGKVDKDFLAELEKRLYLADVGVAATGEIVERVRQAFLDKDITGDVEAFVKQQLRDHLDRRGRRDPLEPQRADRDPRGRRQRLRQDDQHRQAGQAPSGRG